MPGRGRAGAARPSLPACARQHGENTRQSGARASLSLEKREEFRAATTINKIAFSDGNIMLSQEICQIELVSAPAEASLREHDYFP
ncbi:hypothetical protein GCM10025771_15720 [Niveibacterium umoris]